MYPHPPINKKADAEKIFVKFVKDYDEVELIAIGNGTASRETEQFVASDDSRTSFEGANYYCE